MRNKCEFDRWLLDDGEHLLGFDGLSGETLISFKVPVAGATIGISIFIASITITFVFIDMIANFFLDLQNFSHHGRFDGCGQDVSL